MVQAVGSLAGDRGSSVYVVIDGHGGCAAKDFLVENFGERPVSFCDGLLLRQPALWLR